MEKETKQATKSNRVGKNKSGNGKTPKTTTKEFREANLAVIVKTLNTNLREDIPITNINLAVKNELTYMLVFVEKGLKLIKDNIEIYSDLAQEEEEQDINWTEYINHLDCFFFLKNGKIFQKNIDENPPFVFMDFKRLKNRICLQNFKYSKINHRLIALDDDRHKFFVMNLDQKRIEMDLNALTQEKTDYVVNYQIFGKEENKVLSITHEGLLSLHIFNYQMRKLLSSNVSNIELSKDYPESGHSFAVCEKNDYVLVEIASDEYFGSSRMVIFEISSNILIKKVDQDSGSLHLKKALISCAQSGNHILWIGLGYHRLDFLYFYHYNTKSGVLRELKKKKN